MSIESLSSISNRGQTQQRAARTNMHNIISQKRKSIEATNATAGLSKMVDLSHKENQSKNKKPQCLYNITNINLMFIFFIHLLGMSVKIVDLPESQPKRRKNEMRSCRSIDPSKCGLSQEQVQRLFYGSSPVDTTFNAPNSTSFTTLLQSVIRQSTQHTNLAEQINNGCNTVANSQIKCTGNSVISSVDSDSEGKCNVIVLLTV